jgi:hypothetical protein
LELRAGFSGFVENKGVDRERAGLDVQGEMKAFGEQGLHHEARLVTGRRAYGTRLDDVVVAARPGGQMLAELVHLVNVVDFVGEDDVIDNGGVGRDETPGRGVFGIGIKQRIVEYLVSIVRRGVGWSGADGGDIELGVGASVDLPLREVWRLGRKGDCGLG